MMFTMFGKLSDAVRFLGVDIEKHARESYERLCEHGILVEDERKDFILSQAGILHTLPDGAVIRVVLHITQKTLYNAAPPIHEDYHKYHVFNCAALQMMHAIGRGERYCMAARNDGRFRYTLIRHNRVVKEYVGDNGAQLLLCKFCERIYDARINRQGDRPFGLREFLTGADFPGDLCAQHRLDADDNLDVYPRDWALISQRRKAAVDYRCEKCHINLSEARLRRFLQAHHVDGRKSNNSVMNIRVLCVHCHAEEPFHKSLIAGTPLYVEFESTPEFKRHQGRN
jgi:hypothetical protein